MSEVPKPPRSPESTLTPDRPSRRSLLIGAASAFAAPLWNGCASRRPVHRFCHDEAPPDGTITARFLGTTSILFRDSRTAILSDGFVTRPSKSAVVGNFPLRSDPARIADVLDCIGLSRIDAVFTCHSHYDHAMDAAVLARLRGAVLLGSESTWNIGWGEGLPASQLRVVRSGDSWPCGEFELTFIASRHSRPDRVPGVIAEPLKQPARVGAWKGDTAWSVFIRHGRRTALVHGSANYIPEALSGRHADVVYLGIGGLRGARDAFLSAYWHEVVRRTGARRVFLVHWDDFFRGLNRPLKPLPFDSFDRTRQRLSLLAQADRIQVVTPCAWRPVDPFAGLD